MFKTTEMLSASNSYLSKTIFPDPNARLPTYTIKPLEYNGKLLHNVRISSLNLTTNLYTVTYNNNCFRFLRRLSYISDPAEDNIIKTIYPKRVNPIYSYFTSDSGVTPNDEIWVLCSLYIEPGAYKSVDEIVSALNNSFINSLQGLFGDRNKSGEILPATEVYYRKYMFGNDYSRIESEYTILVESVYWSATCQLYNTSFKMIEVHNGDNIKYDYDDVFGEYKTDGILNIKINEDTRELDIVNDYVSYVDENDGMMYININGVVFKYVFIKDVSTLSIDNEVKTNLSFVNNKAEFEWNYEKSILDVNVSKLNDNFTFSFSRIDVTITDNEGKEISFTRSLDVIVNNVKCYAYDIENTNTWLILPGNLDQTLIKPLTINEITIIDENAFPVMTDKLSFSNKRTENKNYSNVEFYFTSRYDGRVDFYVKQANNEYLYINTYSAGDTIKYGAIVIKISIISTSEGKISDFTPEGSVTNNYKYSFKYNNEIYKINTFPNISKSYIPNNKIDILPGSPIFKYKSYHNLVSTDKKYDLTFEDIRDKSEITINFDKAYTYTLSIPPDNTSITAHITYVPTNITSSISDDSITLYEINGERIYFKTQNSKYFIYPDTALTSNIELSSQGYLPITSLNNGTGDKPIWDTIYLNNKLYHIDFSSDIPIKIYRDYSDQISESSKELLYDKFINEMYMKYVNGDDDFITISNKSETEFYINLPTNCVPVELTSTTFTNQINFSSTEQFPKTYSNTGTYKLPAIIRYSDTNITVKDSYGYIYKYNNEIQNVDTFLYSFPQDTESLLSILGIETCKIEYSESSFKTLPLQNIDVTSKAQFSEPIYFIKGRYYSEALYLGPIRISKNLKININNESSNTVNNKPISLNNGFDLRRLIEDDRINGKSIFEKYFFMNKFSSVYSTRNMLHVSNIQLMITQVDIIELLVNIREPSNEMSNIKSFDILNTDDLINDSAVKEVVIGKNYLIPDNGIKVYVTSPNSRYAIINDTRNSFIRVEYTS